MTRPRLNWFLAAAMVCLMLAGQAHAAAACDPYSRDNDSARDARIHRNFPQAQKLVAEVVAHRPADFRANYTAGLTLLDQSGIDLGVAPNPNLVRAGIAQLAKTAALLDTLDPACTKYAQDSGWYGVLNTLAVYYYNTGDMKNAEQMLQRGYAKRAFMNQKTQQKLLDNLGRLYFERNDYGQSARYYTEAGRAGSVGADQRAATAQQLGTLIFKPRGK